ncbi:MAG: hypothetical protein JWL77_4606 [Chthonomonadaceae bacterium]|nr:hypothetical protein [Chthonomonadaceae bacterium]
MRQTTARCGFAIALMVLPLLKATALTVAIQLVPANITMQKFAFQVTNEDRDGMKQFGVTVTAKKEKLSPGLLARLHLSDGKTDFAMVPVEETREGDKVTYWFRVAPNLMGKTRFEFDVLNGADVKDSNGKTRFVALPGTIEYWFYVGDFVPQRGIAAGRKHMSSHAHKTVEQTLVGISPAVL